MTAREVMPDAVTSIHRIGLILDLLLLMGAGALLRGSGMAGLEPTKPPTLMGTDAPSWRSIRNSAGG